MIKLRVLTEDDYFACKDCLRETGYKSADIADLTEVYENEVEDTDDGLYHQCLACGRVIGFFMQ